jgi:hypothetical protein
MTPEIVIIGEAFETCNVDLVTGQRVRVGNDLLNMTK